MGVPAVHPKGFWYDPVAPRSRELGFFFDSRDPKKRWCWHQARPALPRTGWRHRKDCWGDYCRGSAAQPGT
jgi:hypothetical protein